MRGDIMYGELADWWPLLSAPEEYEEEASIFVDLIQKWSRRPAGSLLELGSGGGNNAFHMKAAFSRIALVDRSEAMLRVSGRLNPDCEHVQGDMRSLRLEREFDAVFVHDAVVYAATPADLRAVMTTARDHLVPGGVALFVPDFVKETFRAGTSSGGDDRGERGLRYLAWTWDPDPGDHSYVVDYAFLVREGDLAPRVFQERHEEGLFSRGEWLGLLAEAGFEPHHVPFRHSEVEWEMTAFVGIRRT
ncbi:MAG: class I SAM-dependent methyltransferase [Gemmatimonadetes bacterium]|nr:class I SAM-dependent methyltransferase [Gemmatimonadota bacterium]